jgi:hypothetical protein
LNLDAGQVAGLARMDRASGRAWPLGHIKAVVDPDEELGAVTFLRRGRKMPLRCCSRSCWETRPILVSATRSPSGPSAGMARGLALSNIAARLDGLKFGAAFRA